MEWFERKKPGKKEGYTGRILGCLDKDLIPFLDDRSIADIKAPKLLEALRIIESRGVTDTAHRCLHIRDRFSATPSPWGGFRMTSQPTSRGL
ncbi:MAG: hypothetical protein LBO05_08545 [Deltaproteobacteria bacterium]|jgi:hypothetical protein|nr:hypothetical protein [Deltaproteobacteria bacterium]